MAQNTQFRSIRQLALPRVGGFGGLNPNDYQNEDISTIFELYLIARSLWFRFDRFNWFDTVAWNQFRNELPAFQTPNDPNQIRKAKNIFRKVRDQTQESFFSGITGFNIFLCNYIF